VIGHVAAALDAKNGKASLEDIGLPGLPSPDGDDIVVFAQQQGIGQSILLTLLDDSCCSFQATP
jgi:hypothetical protein